MILKDKKLAAAKNVAHGFFGSKGGVSQGVYASLNCRADENDSKENVAENKKRVLQSLGAPNAAFQLLAQIHSDKVEIVTSVSSPAPKADGLATKEKNLALGILTADCAPLLFADSAAGVIGACHSGWRGAKAGIGEKTIEAMEKLGANRKSIIAAIGPCIGPNSYEISQEFYDGFIADGGENKKYFKPGKPGHFYFNLPGYVEDRLKKFGVGQIKWLGNDTLPEESDYFSYRRNTLANVKNYGCQVSAICLV